MKGAILGFILGAVAGGAAVYFSLKAKMEREKEEEVNATIESVNRVAEVHNKQSLDEYIKNLDVNNYTYDHANVGTKEPHQISVDEYDNLYSDWEHQYLICYENGIVVDEDKAMIKSPESMLGVDYNKKLLENDEGITYIANPMLRKIFILDLYDSGDDDWDSSDEGWDEEYDEEE